ncbi:RIP metalloprotease RseP [Tenacibaculum finnmarkense genomovar finnmarkense]|uniref:RIP metalloprotease RseP n=1 Tax=Tenacibaculum finnmarkense TaxID=2781243 RepID=UPI001E603D4A|nr:RIP metalloprotease RseP [Tenacibaculum finnmarkense]MCD8417200.1 RIP metalloprotease RseP [Tenacibaculum finnmarkense genomovar finnmarkense]MCG8185583.1 RIP metalloprotease RseP [Tenacibaculum finnmarkense genomovar finnmarkense]MCG8202131.1 RIP metalloprotease RseP [Tenacibaculum finnmarkense genomovar finnmarkense]MCG8209581.1 RIP metalloprotease RseP [Tenacibaculum finnmarkense genomovar finnmarkense]MCG8212379.1 RIP metalloprotease RseP [Tenacibaculum finnmarkense genomovar finnmarken
METLIKAVQFILSLSLLIVLHELGHFIPAKIFKTKVEKFYLFFDYKFSIFKKKIGDTVYGIGWIPLGGYVKIAGMIDESMDTEQLNKPAQPWEFRSKPAWQRLIIMLGGVTVNFILGIVIYICLMYTYGEKFLPNDNLKDGVWVQNQLGKDLGLQTGDKILTIDGQAIRKFSELPLEFINGNNYTIQRNGVVIEKEIPTDFISKLVDRDKNSGSFISVRLPLVIANISKDSPNINSDLQAKDIVTAINGVSTKYLDQAKIELEKNKGQAVNITIQRASESLNIPVKITEKGKLGVGLGQLSSKDLEKLGYYKLAKKTYSISEAIPAGAVKAWSTVTNYIKQLKKVFNPSTGAYKGLGGFISIGSIFPAEFSWEVFWNITAFLSIMLGVMNLLPIPALDGGHVVFTLWEMITGKKPGDKFLEYAQLVGFILLITLLLFANGNDIFRTFFK